MAENTVNTPATEINPATLSIPTDKPFRLIVDVTPIFGTAFLPFRAGDPRKVRTGPAQL